MDFVITAKRLTLRPFCAGEAEALCKIANQKYVLRWMPDWESTMEDAEDVIRFFADQRPKACKTEAKIMFAMELEGKIIGMIGIGNKEECDDEIEIAYFISEAYAGNGYMTEAAYAVSRWAFKNLKLDYLIAIADVSNIPSQRVLEKCGFRKIETRRLINSGETEEKPYFYYRLYND